jgi:ANTAR domain/GAF domain/Histidine kinase-like ATPase domain
MSVNDPGPGQVTRCRDIVPDPAPMHLAMAGGGPMTMPREPASRPAASRSREQELSRTFVMLADSLVEDYDIVDLLERLTEACVRLLGVTAAGLLLNDQQGRLTVVASSSEETRLLEIFQLQNDQGPCLECVRTGTAVVSGDLDADRSRWPLFASFAVEAGFRSVAALPMRLREQTIGGLNLFYDHAVPVAPEDQRLAQALADVATTGILQQPSAQRSTLLAEHLQRALSSRVVIEQAKGVLAERNGMSMEVAFDSLRLYARDQNLKLTDLAVAIVHHDFNPAFRSGPPPVTWPVHREKEARVTGTVAQAASTYTGVFCGRPDQVSRVRREVAQYLAGHAAADDAVLIVSELATNAVLHSQSGGQFFTVRVYQHDTWCRLEVEDAGGPWDAGPRDSTRPHGLDVIQAVAGSGNWGVDGDGAGRVVWVRLSW